MNHLYFLSCKKITSKIANHYYDLTPYKLCLIIFFNNFRSIHKSCTVVPHFKINYFFVAFYCWTIILCCEEPSSDTPANNSGSSFGCTPLDLPSKRTAQELFGDITDLDEVSPSLSSLFSFLLSFVGDGIESILFCNFCLCAISKCFYFKGWCCSLMRLKYKASNLYGKLIWKYFL